MTTGGGDLDESMNCSLFFAIAVYTDYCERSIYFIPIDPTAFGHERTLKAWKRGLASTWIFSVQRVV
jgi:hypothetical protein